MAHDWAQAVAPVVHKLAGAVVKQVREAQVAGSFLIYSIRKLFLTNKLTIS